MSALRVQIECVKLRVYNECIDGSKWSVDGRRSGGDVMAKEETMAMYVEASKRGLIPLLLYLKSLGNDKFKLKQKI